MLHSKPVWAELAAWNEKESMKGTVLPGGSSSWLHALTAIHQFWIDRGYENQERFASATCCAIHA